ncbi:hypothetical protein BCU70_15575 [Vibrio sp. 10N.286.49.C2]|nr:hypothetical protein BCU70_15575 [Vibrio sp. 10N.286.49.C2]PMH49405.1 hypothetical protein BCU66_20240 [Vibrio sp. 10N.286.49.B1]
MSGTRLFEFKKRNLFAIDLTTEEKYGVEMSVEIKKARQLCRAFGFVREEKRYLIVTNSSDPVG